VVFRRPAARRVPALRCLHVRAEDRLAGERIYYDRGRCCGNSVFSMSRRAYWDRSPFLATHPARLVRAFVRKLLDGDFCSFLHAELYY